MDHSNGMSFINASSVSEFKSIKKYYIADCNLRIGIFYIMSVMQPAHDVILFYFIFCKLIKIVKRIVNQSTQDVHMKHLKKGQKIEVTQNQPHSQQDPM